MRGMHWSSTDAHFRTIYIVAVREAAQFLKSEPTRLTAELMLAHAAAMEAVCRADNARQSGTLTGKGFSFIDSHELNVVRQASAQAKAFLQINVGPVLVDSDAFC